MKQASRDIKPEFEDPEGNPLTQHLNDVTITVDENGLLSLGDGCTWRYAGHDAIWAKFGCNGIVCAVSIDTWRLLKEAASPLVDMEEANCFMWGPGIGDVLIRIVEWCGAWYYSMSGWTTWIDQGPFANAQGAKLAATDLIGEPFEFSVELFK